MQLLQCISKMLAHIDSHPKRSMWMTTMFAIVYYLLIGLQGLDYADEGFSLTFYRYIFTQPQDVEYLFLYYFTGIIGGAWEYFFGSLGNYSYRILFAITSGGITLTTFAILLRYFKPSTVTLATVACILWPGLCLYYFNHDCLTILLFLLMVYMLLKGLDGKLFALWIAGGLLALNILTRLPNAATAILILLPFIPAIYNGCYSQAFGYMLRILGGCFIVSIIMELIMYLADHLMIYLSSISSLFVMSSDSSDSHNLTQLLSEYLYAYKSIVTSTIYGLTIGLIIIILLQQIKQRSATVITFAIGISLFYILLTRSTYAMWGAVTAGSIIYLLNQRHDPKIATLGISALVMLIVIPLGGDSYNNISNSCMWLGMPMLISLFRKPLRWDISICDHYNTHFHISMNVTTNKIICLIAGIAFILYVISHSVCYFDEGSKLLKTHRPNVESVTTFTSQQRAELTQQVAQAIEQNRLDGNYLLVFDNAPMLHYITDMKPYLGSPWSYFWGEDMFKRQLFRSENSTRPLPLIAVPKFYYSDLSYIDYNNDILLHDRQSGKIEALYHFMQRYNYAVVHNDSYITLYAPHI